MIFNRMNYYNVYKRKNRIFLKKIIMTLIRMDELL
jgi:hypothetical protein